MRVIGVLDLLDGRAVHARAGRRERYAPVTAAAGVPIDSGDAIALARAYIERLGIVELYAADLDAILGRPAQDEAIGRIAALGVPLWVDGGVQSSDRARRLFDLGASHVVVGLETLPSYRALAEICAAAGGDRVAFSLDLREGTPIVAASAAASCGDPSFAATAAERVAARAADCGVGAIIVIDLARVGTGRGVDMALIERVRRSAPGVLLVAGGGVRGADDLTALADAGCDGALVATSLLDGRVGTADVAAARR